MKRILVTLLAMLCLVANATGHGKYAIHKATEPCIDVSGFMEFLPDSSRKLTFAEITSDSLGAKFQDFLAFKPQQTSNTRDGKSAVFWAKVSISNETDEPGNYYFETAGFDTVTIYWIDGHKKQTIYHDADKKYSLNDTVNRLTFFKRQHIYILPGEVATVYIRYVRPAESRWFIFNLLLWDVQQCADGVTLNFTIHSFFLAILLLTLIYTVFLYYSFREKTYLWFCLMEAGFILLILDWSNVGIAFIGKHQFWSLISKYVEVFGVVPAIQMGTYMFASSFIHFKSLYPRLHRLFIAAIGVGLLVLIVVYLFLGSNKLFNSIENNSYLVWGLLILLLFSIATVKKVPYASIMLISLLLLQMPIIIPLVSGELPIVYWLEISISAQIILWLGIISFKIRTLRKEYSKSQSDLVGSLQENEKLIRKQNEELEQKVEERTVKLKAANETLSDTIQYLKETQGQLIETEKQKENEILRTRISQDIHDDISSELTKISWMSELANLKALKADMQDAASLLEKITASSRETIVKLGEIIWAVNPDNDSLESLLSYMRNYMAKFLSDTGFKYVINFPDIQSGPLINPELKRNLFLVMKESLNNAVKYSQANMIEVGFRIEENQYTLVVKDDGKGLNMEVVQGTGNGLKNMRERMEHIKGSLTINSSPGSGTELIFQGRLY